MTIDWFFLYLIVGIIHFTYDLLFKYNNIGRLILSYKIVICGYCKNFGTISLTEKIKIYNNLKQ